MFNGVKRVGVYCPPVRAIDPWDEFEGICIGFQRTLKTRYGMDATLGTTGLSDPDTLFFVLNAHPDMKVLDASNKTLSTIPKPITALTIRLFRAGHTNAQLRDMAPLLLVGKGTDESGPIVAQALALQISGVLGWIKEAIAAAKKN